MTAIAADGYGVIYLTPNQLVDFSVGEATVAFDVSTLRLSHRDWIDLWITPYADNLQLPAENWLADPDGEPRNAIRVRMDDFNGGTVFKAWVIRDFQGQAVDDNWWTSYESLLTPSAVRRDTFERHPGRTHLKFGMPSPGDDVVARGKLPRQD
jgi:hypothetical protein